MYWWHAAAMIVGAKQARQFGLIATNSLSQSFNRQVVQAAFTGRSPISFAYAIADHPWVDSSDGAAVRIAMTVGRVGSACGTLAVIRQEAPLLDGSADIQLLERSGTIHASLSIGADFAATSQLRANAQLALR